MNQVKTLFWRTQYATNITAVKLKEVVRSVNVDTIDLFPIRITVNKDAKTIKRDAKRCELSLLTVYSELQTYHLVSNSKYLSKV